MMLADTVLDAAALDASASKVETTVRYQPLQWTLSDIGFGRAKRSDLLSLDIAVMSNQQPCIHPMQDPHGTAACIDPIVRA
jgi:hypothetical protein